MVYREAFCCTDGIAGAWLYFSCCSHDPFDTTELGVSFIVAWVSVLKQVKKRASEEKSLSEVSTFVRHFFGEDRTFVLPKQADTRLSAKDNLVVGVHALALALELGGEVGLLLAILLGVVVVRLGEATGAVAVGLGLHEEGDQEAARRRN
eukprot:1182668-Prorocentrum_minimum.AAC.1